MPTPPGILTASRPQVLLIGVAAAVLAIGGFEAGRKTVDAAAVAKSTATKSAQPPADLVSQTKTLLERDHSRVTVREIATVPFSELYDVLKSAPREQLLAWARDLEQMPSGPRQRAAVAAYYKSLIQVDHRAAIEAVLHAQNLPIRDAALNAMTKAAPESIWAELAEMMEQLPYPGRFFDGEDVIENWSRVDPFAVSQFLERHPLRAEESPPDGEDRRAASLLGNWAEIDPNAAKRWLEEDASRQSTGALLAFVTGWGRVDSGAAIQYVVANANDPKFEKATNELVYEFVRSAKENATRLVLLLPPEKAKAALKNVVETIAPEYVDPNVDRPPDYQRPADEVARWIGSFPLELWPEKFGKLAVQWMDEDPASGTIWFDQLPLEKQEDAIIRYCRAANAGDAEHVLALSRKLSDPRQRIRVVTEYAKALGSEFQSADEAISNMDISDADKDYLRKLRTEKENGR